MNIFACILVDRIGPVSNLWSVFLSVCIMFLDFIFFGFWIVHILFQFDNNFSFFLLLNLIYILGSIVKFKICTFNISFVFIFWVYAYTYLHLSIQSLTIFFVKIKSKSGLCPGSFCGRRFMLNLLTHKAEHTA